MRQTRVIKSLEGLASMCLHNSGFQRAGYIIINIIIIIIGFMGRTYLKRRFCLDQIRMTLSHGITHIVTVSVLQQSTSEQRLKLNV